MDSDSVAPSVVSDHPQVLEQDLEPTPGEEEWDELSSDIMDEEPVERIPGESLLPSLRLESIIQADGVMGSLALSKEGLFILSVATEEFIKRLVQGGHRQASAERRTTVNYRDMAATTQQYQEFMFLQETIPSPVSLSEALKLRDLKEKEMLEDDPALTAPTTTYSTTVGYTPSTSKPKVKNRVANGKDKQYRGGSSSRSESRAHSQIRWDYEDVPASNGHQQQPTSTRGGRESGWTRWPNGQNFVAVDPLLAAAAASQQNGPASLAHQRPSIPPVNGHTPTPPPPRPRDADPSPARLHPNYWQHSASSWAKAPDTSGPQSDSASNGPTTPAQPQADLNTSSAGPTVPNDSSTSVDASSPSIRTLGEPIGPSSLVSQNPGRTIYSQKKPPQ
ncbi:hypothetical protein B0H17DRAFT_989554 [Mycena rosella]|uniref:Transcription factor CBF/NF-Y/archaeal histone domain-containing protein n=1 Tax=Mycena rosella TaxID=1033263 RepID=A0AAD7CY83_MYCRO|nr:hypothetical protein B0H17DRAFT_989554 [Mycena rosella]